MPSQPCQTTPNRKTICRSSGNQQEEDWYDDRTDDLAAAVGISRTLIVIAILVLCLAYAI